MVLESILKPGDVEKRPELIIIMSIVVTSIAIILTNVAFASESSMLWIAFVTIALIPFMVQFFKEIELETVLKPESPSSFMERNAEVLKMYFLLFFGIIFATTLWYTILPEEVNNTVFGEQINTMQDVRALGQTLTGQFLGGQYGQNAIFIFENNTWVLILILLTSFLYGAGALFIITWNASVIGVFIGTTVKQLYTTLYASHAQGGILAFGHGFYLGLGILPHGLLELSAYTLAAIAGSLISAAIVNPKHPTKEFQVVFRDAFILTIMAVALLAIGALVEAMAL